MANEALRAILQHLRRVADRNGSAKPTDAELLERFAVTGDQAAFEVLVWRHGPMVLNLCRRILRHEQDAEDAFQATFLALVRKAGSIVKQEAVGSWLFKVAYRVALEANAKSALRAGRETADAETLAAHPTQDLADHELHLALGEEVNRLPDKYRVPLVLHCFDGKTGHEVAQQLGCSEGTVRVRLARARERLRVRLARRGLTLSPALLAAGPSPGMVSPVSTALVDSSVRAAAQHGVGGVSNAGAVSAEATALAERVLKVMFLNKLKQTIAGVLIFSVLTAGAGLSLRQALAAIPTAQEKDNAVKSSAGQATQPKDDRTEIRGTWVSWTTVTRSTDRETFPPEKVKVTTVITDDKFMVVGDDGFLSHESSYKLDPTQTPKAIDEWDQVTGTVLLGIYELNGDTLKLAYGRDKRPTEFPAKATIFQRVSRTFAPVAQRYANAPGCFWIKQPNGKPGAGSGFALGGVGMNYIFDKEPDGAAVVTMSYLTPEPKAREYRPVLVDAQGKRYLPKLVMGVSSGGRRGEAIVTLHRWRMDPNVLPADKAAGLGIEALTPQSRAIAAREAQERAKSLHIEVLPWPQPGQPYSFTLTTVDGQKIRSEDLKGKVVLVHCWATNSAGARWMMPELKALYDKWHKRGLEIVGVSRNGDIEIVRKICKSEGVTWPQILVPEDERLRELWQEASAIETGPSVLIIDQQGILQADSTEKLEERIGKLLGRSSKQPALTPHP